MQGSPVGRCNKPTSRARRSYPRLEKDTGLAGLVSQRLIHKSAGRLPSWAARVLYHDPQSPYTPDGVTGETNKMSKVVPTHPKRSPLFVPSSLSTLSLFATELSISKSVPAADAGEVRLKDDDWLTSGCADISEIWRGLALTAESRGCTQRLKPRHVSCEP